MTITSFCELKNNDFMRKSPNAEGTSLFSPRSKDQKKGRKNTGKRRYAIAKTQSVCGEFI